MASTAYFRQCFPYRKACSKHGPPVAAGENIEPARGNTHQPKTHRHAFLMLIGLLVVFFLPLFSSTSPSAYIGFLSRTGASSTLLSKLLPSLARPSLRFTPSTDSPSAGPSSSFPILSKAAFSFFRNSAAGFLPVPFLLYGAAQPAVVGVVNEDGHNGKDSSAKNPVSHSASPATSSSTRGAQSTTASASNYGGSKATSASVDKRSRVPSGSLRDITEEQKKSVETSKARILAQKQALELSGMENYQKFLRTHPVSMVMFYASWCVWSRRAMPEFDALARLVVLRESPVILAKVEASTEEDIASLENVMEFPLVKLYVEGRSQQYMGPVMQTPMLAWLVDKLDRDRLLVSPALVDALVKSGSHSLVVLAAFPPGSPKQTFVRVARTLASDVVFGHVESPALIDHVKEQHIVRLLNEEEEQLRQQQQSLAQLTTAAAAAAFAGDAAKQRQLEAQLRWEREYLDNYQREQKARRAVVMNAVQQLPFVVALSKARVDPPVHIFDGNPSDLSRLEAFVLRYRFPLLSVLRPQRLPDNFFQDRRPLALLMLDTRASPTALRGIEDIQGVGAALAGPPEPLVAALMKSGAQHRHVLLCTVAGNTEPHERYFLDLLGVEDDHLPAIRAMTLLSEGDGRVHPEYKYKPTPALMHRLGVAGAAPLAKNSLPAKGNREKGGEGGSAGGGDAAAAQLREEVLGAAETGDASLYRGGIGSSSVAETIELAERYAGDNVVLTPEILTAFLDAFVARNLEPYYRSEAIPEEEDLPRRPGTVRILVGLNYRQVIVDTEEDVLVEFYAPWCGHCRKFEPVYKELAARLRDVKGIFLAKVDGNRNEIPGMRVTAYPTLILFPAQTKKRLESMQTARSFWYNGDKTMPDMLRWLAKKTEKARINVNQLLSIDLAQRDAAEADVDGTVTKSVLEEL